MAQCYLYAPQALGRCWLRTVRMKRKSISYTLALAALAVATMIPSAAASTLTYELGLVDAGSGPETSAPWIRAVFSSFSDDKVLLRIEATDLMAPGQFITQIGFNYDGIDEVNLLPCDTALCGGIAYGTAPSPALKPEGKISPGGTFSFVLGFPTPKGPNRFERTEYGNYLLTAAGLTLRSFDAYSETNDNKPGFKTYAHVQGFGGNAKIYDNSSQYAAAYGEYAGANIPEPGVTLLIGSGLLGFGLLARRRRKV